MSSVLRTWGLQRNSDLDILVNFDVGDTLIDLVGVQQYLENKLGYKVGVVSQRALREEIRANVLNDLIRL